MVGFKKKKKITNAKNLTQNGELPENQVETQNKKKNDLSMRHFLEFTDRVLLLLLLRSPAISPGFTVLGEIFADVTGF